MLINAVKGYKALDNDEEAEMFIKRAHSLIKFKKSGKSKESDESSDFEIKKESLSDEE